MCTLNSGSHIEECLRSLTSINVGEIIVVDGGSKDNTLSVCTKYASKILRDKGTGLAQARNIGIAAASKKYVLNFGSDNIISHETLHSMLNKIENFRYDGVAATTIITHKSYLASCMNMYKLARYYEGEKTIIGTPNLFERALLTRYPYLPEATHSDDSYLCLQLKNENDSMFYMVGDHVIEIGKFSLKEVLQRWKNYGRSDYEVYNRESVNWSFMRKCKSLIYPFTNELYLPLLRTRGLLNKFYVVPFLIFITIVRYLFWAKNHMKGE